MICWARGLIGRSRLGCGPSDWVRFPRSPHIYKKENNNDETNWFSNITIDVLVGI
jgi:hypothetical protein